MSTASTLDGLAEELGQRYSDGGNADPRLLRAKLMASELGEVIAALAASDQEDLADGLADLEYVVVGTAVVYDVPLGHVFDEVHKSNMTKSNVAESVRNHSGDRGKGPGYVPPVFSAVTPENVRCAKLQVGDQVATMDGRRMGNATVLDVKYGTKPVEIVRYHMRSDFGNEFSLSPRELFDQFHVVPICCDRLF